MSNGIDGGIAVEKEAYVIEGVGDMGAVLSDLLDMDDGDEELI